jgi:hypothetical protein
MQNIDDDPAIIKASDAPGIEGKGSITKQPHRGIQPNESDIYMHA